MARATDADAMVDAAPGGRTYRILRRPLLSDCAPSGRARLDALARWMQDVAFADVEDAGLERAAVWVLRRHRIRVLRFPRFGEHCAVHTFCSGIGRMWAERRTTITLGCGGHDCVDDGSGDDGRGADGRGEPLVEALALWVHLDPVRLLPSPVTDAELEVYRTSAHNHKVAARLRHPRPERVEKDWRWRFHRTDADIAAHVNNAAYWEPIEDELLGDERELTQEEVELEFRAPAQPGPVQILAGDGCRWITDPESGDVYASALLVRAQ